MLFQKGHKINKGRVPWNKDKKMSDAFRKKVSETTKKAMDNPELKERISQITKGRKHTEEWKKEISEKLRKAWQEGTMKGAKGKRWGCGFKERRKKKNFYNKLRRNKKKVIGGSHTLEQWEEIKKKYNYMCLCCKKLEPEIILTEDHVVPLDRWDGWIKEHLEVVYGCNDIENIQPLCRSCNSIKGIKIITFSKITFSNDYIQTSN
ncbi:MAG TPA: HNH endonuclease [bacterium]|nr:HNH endonuclease [bacterium]